MAIAAEPKIILPETAGKSHPLRPPPSCPTGSKACVAERRRRFGARPRSGPARRGGRAPPTRRPEASAYSLVERVAPNALDVGPRSAPLHALRTTRSTTRLKRGARVHSATPMESSPPKDRPLEATNTSAYRTACMPLHSLQSVSPAAHRLARCTSVAGAARLIASPRHEAPTALRYTDQESYRYRSGGTECPSTETNNRSNPLTSIARTTVTVGSPNPGPAPGIQLNVAP